jgi:hypothetical protein
MQISNDISFTLTLFGILRQVRGAFRHVIKVGMAVLGLPFSPVRYGVA